MAKFTQVGTEVIVKGTAKFDKDLANADRSISNFGKNIGGKIAAGAKIAATALVGVGVAAVGIGIASVKAAVSFESAFAGVIKTTDGLTDSTGELTTEGEKLQRGFRDLAKEAPIAIEELLQIGELGGQLGVAREDLLGFTETIAAMGVATNLTTEEAAVGFAQLASVMGTPQEEIENLGSSIVALGNSFETNERDILSFAQRIAGVGNIAGLTEPQVLAIGAAMSSVGVKAEAGGTAVQKVLLGMNQAAISGGEQMEIFAGIAGIEADKFGAAWEEDAGKTFTAFVEGLGESGDDAVNVLSALGLENSQTIRAFLSLAGAGDKLAETMDVASLAFDENTALAKEAAQRYATTESQFKIFKNTINDVAITIGSKLLPFVNDLIAAARPLISEFGNKVAGFMTGTLIPAIERLIGAFRRIIDIAIAVGRFLAFVVEEGDTLNDWLTHIPESIRPFVQGMGEIVAWLRDAIPQAIQIASDIWTGTMVPAIQTVVDIVRVVIDIVREVIANFGALGDFPWEDIVPAWAADAANAIAGGLENLISWLRGLVTWLQEKIPEAVQAAASVWSDTLQPALNTVWTFITESIIPAIGDLVTWLKKKIPEAVQAASDLWTDELQPALSEVWKFIEESVIPAISDLVDWLKKKIPEAVQAASDLWTGTLRPALEEVTAFVDENVGPILAGLAAVVGTVLVAAFAAWATSATAAAAATLTALAPIVIPLAAIGVAVALLKKAWDENWNGIRDKVEAVLKAITKFVNEKIIPIFEKITSWLGKNIPKAIAVAQEFFENVLLPVLDDVWNFISGTVIPILQDLIDFLQDLLADAIQTASDFFTDTLQPAMQEVGDFINDTLIPIIQDIISWLEVNIPRAIENARLAWEEIFKPALQVVAAFITDTLIPTISAIVAWLVENMPVAIEAARKAWEEIFKPALETVGKFIAETVIPIIEDIVAWIAEKTPEAIEFARKAWEEVLKPALEAVWKFINESVIPIIVDIVDWLKVKIPEAIELAKKAWKEVLQPALAAVWKFISENVIPIIEKIVNWLKISIPNAIEFARKAWEETLKPALETVWKFITETLIPAFQGIVDFIFNDLIPAAVDLATGFIDAIASIIDFIVGLPEALAEVISSLVKIGEQVIAAIVQGIQDGWQGLVDWFKGKLSDLTDLLPFSEPKDPTSPLSNLSDAGRGIVNNLLAGMQQEMPKALAVVKSWADELRKIIEEATKGIEGVAPTQSELGKLLTGLGGVFSGLGGAAARRLKERIIGPTKDVVKAQEEALQPLLETFETRAAIIAQEQRDLEIFRRRFAEEEAARDPDIPKAGRSTLERNIEALEARIGGRLARQRRLAEDIADARAETAKHTKSIREEEERILRLQRAQQDLQFLQQQFKLLELIEERGLDLRTILGDVKLGVNADVRGLVDAMTRAIQAIIVQAEETLGISSPSKVFMGLGREVMRGLAEGVRSRITLPEQAVSLATTRMIAAPAVAGPAMTTNQFNLGGNNINTGMDIATFEARVLRVVERAVRQ